MTSFIQRRRLLPTLLMAPIACVIMCSLTAPATGQSGADDSPLATQESNSTDPRNDEAYQAMRHRINEAELELRIQQASGQADGSMIVNYLEEVDSIRRAFVTIRPQHPLAPVVRLDRAYDLVFRLYELNDLRLRSFYGTPTPSEQESINIILERLVDVVHNIDASVQMALDWYESQPTFDSDEQLQQLRGELARVHRDVRLPLATGSFAFLRAMYDANLSIEQRNAHFVTCTEQLRDIVDRLQGMPQSTVGAMVAISGAHTNRGTIVQSELMRRAEADATLRDQLETHLLRATCLRFQGTPNQGLKAMAEHRIASETIVDDLSFEWALLQADTETALRIAERGRSARPIVACFLPYMDLALNNAPTISRLRRVVEDLARHTPSIRLVTAPHPMLAAALLNDPRTTDEERADLASRASAFTDFESALRLAHLDAVCPSNGDGPQSAAEAQALRSSMPLRHDPADLLAANMTLLRALQGGTIETDDAFAPDGPRAMRTFVDALSSRGMLPAANVDAWYRHVAWAALQENRADAALDALDQQSLDNPFSAPLRITAFRMQFHAAEDDAECRILAQRIVDTADEGRRVRSQTGIGPATLDARLQLYAADALLELDDVQGAASRLAAAANLPLTAETVREAQAIQVRLQLAAGGIAQAAQSARALLRVHSGSSAGLESIYSSVLEEAVIALVGDWRSDLVPPFGDDIAKQCAALMDDLEPAFRTRHGVRCGFLYLAAGRFDDAVRAYETASSPSMDVNEQRAGLAEALFHRHKSEEDEERAFALFRDVAAATANGGDRTWIDWLAQLRQLEILDRIGRNTNQIGPRLRRLQAEDPELGGPSFRASFQVLIERYLASGDTLESSNPS